MHNSPKGMYTASKKASFAKWQKGGKIKKQSFTSGAKGSGYVTELINKKSKLTEIMEITPQVESGCMIKGTTYNFNKVDLEACFVSYLKQEIVWDDFKGYVLAFIEFLKETKPELFATNKAFGTATSAEYKPRVKYAEGVQPKTQKAKGIQFVSKNAAGFSTLPFEILTGDERDRSAVEVFMKEYAEVFARPCPEVPRHGFVDSRKVSSVEAVLDLYKEVREVDEKGEMVIMPPIEATKNCVITENSITVGKGHDGATAGVNAQVFPIFGTWKDSFGDISKAGIAAGDVPYLETVTKSSKHYLVQMRGGPSITSRALDYVPTETVVSRVIKAEGDLLKWETIMRENAGIEGVVVDHSGGALTSHFGVHAILNNIPVLTTRVPVVGETLAVVNDTVTHDYLSMINGLLDSLAEEFSPKHGAAKRVTAMIYATQYFSALGGSQSYFIGHAIGTMLNLGQAACGGEYRHHPNNPFKGKYGRHRVYVKATRDFIGTRKKLAKWARSFAIDSWPGGFGGLKWYDCADAIIQLDTEARAFLRAPNTATFNNVMMAMNRAINCAHNGGWWFNKYISEGVFNQINREHLPTVLDAVTYLYEQSEQKFTLSTLDMYQKYSNAKVINPKVAKNAVLVPVAAQCRLIGDEGVKLENVTAETLSANAKVRVQINWGEHNTCDENTIDVADLVEKWDFNNTNYSKSWASGLVAYVPMTWTQDGNEWVFSLASNNKELYRRGVKYGYVAEEKA